MNDSYLTITRSNSIFIMAFMACLTVSKLIAVPINSVNVKDFGAVGDGVADDTAAIQKAIAASTERKANILLARQPMVDDLPELAHLKALSTTTENTIQPEVFLPKGVYRVRKTLVAGSLVLRGENGTVIRMENPSQDILYSHWGYRVRVSNVTFDGGRRQLLLYTGNNDMANFCVEGCVFRNSSAAAIWSHNYRRPGGHDFSTMTMGPYTVENTPDGPKLTPNDETQPYFAHSTLAIVSDCHFEECAMAVDMATDGCQLERCVFVTSKPLEQPAFVGGMFNRYVDLDCRAVKAVGDKACWFAGRGGTISGGKFRLDTPSADMPAIRWTSGKYISEVPSALSVRHAQFDGIGQALLRIENRVAENSPQLLDFDGVTLDGISSQIPAVVWEVPFNLELAQKFHYNFKPALDIFEGAKMTVEPPYLWSISRCKGLSTADIPAVFSLNKNGDVTPEQETTFAVERPAPPTAVIEAKFLDARDFSVDDDPDSDDTAALQSLFAAARKEIAPVCILLPPILMRISQPLELPAECSITVRGNGCLLQSNQDMPIFHGVNVKTLSVEHLRLAWGSVAFDVTESPKALMHIDKCFFYQQRKCAVKFTGGRHNDAAVTVSRCTFVSPVQGVDSDAATTWLENNWASTNGRQDRQAFIVNRGNMHCWGLLGVPMPMKDHGRNHLPIVPNWPFANDLRWFDNYARLSVRQTRFGGEYYGYVPVFNYAKGGTIAIEGSFACFGFPDCRNCIVYCEAQPSEILFRNFGWEWRRGIQRSVKTATSDMAVPVLQRNFLWTD